VSVKKICNPDQVVVFDNHGYVIFKGEVSVKGLEVHTQDLDPQTGLYPITLNIKDSGTYIDTQIKKFSNMGELRQQSSCFSLWARSVCENGERNFY
jgi:hypothetical protein